MKGKEVARDVPSMANLFVVGLPIPFEVARPFFEESSGTKNVILSFGRADNVVQIGK